MFPCVCPSCQEQLKVKSLKCDKCGTEVSGSYDLPLLARLSPQDQDFVTAFMLCSGSLKEMARQLGMSYPTVRNLLDDVIGRIRALQQQEQQ